MLLLLSSAISLIQCHFPVQSGGALCARRLLCHSIAVIPWRGVTIQVVAPCRQSGKSRVERFFSGKPLARFKCCAATIPHAPRSVSVHERTKILLLLLLGYPAAANTTTYVTKRLPNFALRFSHLDPPPVALRGCFIFH